MPDRVRDVLFWLHLALGLPISLVAVLLCLTGAILAVELPVTRWSDRARVEVPAEPARLPVDRLVRDAASAEGREPVSVAVGRDPRDAVEVSFGRRDGVAVDPYRGMELDEGALHGLFRSTMFLHRWLLLEGTGRDIARQVVGVSTLAFVALVPTGLLLWLPRRWRWGAVRAVLWFRSGLKGKARDFNWHHVFGLWFALPLLFFAVTGAGIGYRWLADGLVALAPAEAVEVADPVLPPPDGASLDDRTARLEGALAVAGREVPDWQTLSVAIPSSVAAPLEVTVDRGNGRQPQHRAVLSIDASGAVVARRGWAEESGERRVRSWIRFGHTGEMMGLPGLVLAVVSCLAGAVLGWTGLALSWRRWQAWRRRVARRVTA